MSKPSTFAALRNNSHFASPLNRPLAAPFTCWKCQVQARRSITTRVLERRAEGVKQWAEFAKEIRDGKRESVLTILEKRGFVHALAGEKKFVSNLMIDKRVGVYCGVDPTAPSLHVGHMVAMMALFWMYLYGHHTVALIGAATARIGDPTGRTTNRREMSPTERKANVASMHFQMKTLWRNLEVVGRNYGFTDRTHHHRELVNNSAWWNKLAFLDVLKYMGRVVRLGPMLGRDTVKTKLESGDGMSFSEFCYPIMQSWDFWQLYDEKGIQMQIGGQDQFGNIVSGIEAIKQVQKTHPNPDVRVPDDENAWLKTPIGFTVPLLTTASGEKFGKSAGNAIWLDSQMTSPFDLFSFFMRTADADVEKYLKLFTFIPLPEIQSLMAKHNNDPSRRDAQHRLAMEFLELVHGKSVALETKALHKAQFDDRTNLRLMLQNAEPGLAVPTTPEPAPHNPFQDNQNPATREKGTFVSPSLNKYAPPVDHNSNRTIRVVLPKCLVFEQPIARVLYAAGLVTSRSEGHRLATAQGAYIGNKSGVKGRKGKNPMDDSLNFTPAKLHDKSQTWNFVIRDEEHGGVGDMMKEGEEGLLILRVGKWKIRVCRIVSDELFDTLGLPDPPGYAEVKAERTMMNSQKVLQEGLQATQESRARAAADEAANGEVRVAKGEAAVPERTMDKLNGELGAQSRSAKVTPKDARPFGQMEQSDSMAELLKSIEPVGGRKKRDVGKSTW